MLAVKAGEFTQRDAAFRLEADIDDREIILNRGDDALSNSGLKTLILAEVQIRALLRNRRASAGRQLP